MAVLLAALVGGPAVGAESAQSKQGQKQTSDVAQLDAPTKPAYPLGCGVDAEFIVESKAPELPPPTAEQLRTLRMLQQEAKAFTESAEDFRGKLTTIVRHHYEDRRRRILAAIDQEIEIEKSGLTDARQEAIARLEQFIQTYSGANADPQATPDAMFRLAALYEEKAREDFDADLSETLKPAMALYRDVATQFPGYDELAAVLYYLGHAYLDAGRMDEAQQSWRSLVCANKYQIRAPEGEAGGLVVQELPQDRTDEYWTEWYNKNPLPLDQAGERPNLDQVGVKEEELSFKDPYANCEPVPQDILPGQEPRYVAEVWWQLGNYHFDQIDPRGGPYNLNRAAAAYERSMEYKRPPLYGVAMYKLAWTYFKQQRYGEATRWFVNLLHYADEQEEKTGDPGADFRAEAYTYIAGSLTYVDFVGPPAEDPFIPRNDVLDLETDPLVAEEKMAVAIERVQDPELIPQDKKWTSEIYKALAREFIEISQNRNAIRTLELIVERFPMDRDVPVTINRISELYDELAKLAPRGSETRQELAQAALDWRTRLVNYVGTSEWTNANRDDPEALEQAEALSKIGLRRAAADHTNYARRFKERAFELSDAAEQTRALEAAIDEYKLAAGAWKAYLEQDRNAIDAYESKFWLADSNFWVAVLQVPLGRMPSQEQIDQARKTAAAVRDSNQDDKYKQPAAYYVVTLAEKVLDAEARAYQESDGAQGIPRREEVAFVGEGEARKVKAEELPEPVTRAVCARDQYNAAITLAEDPEKNGLMYASQAADYFFVYGQFDEARRRYIPIYEKYCGKNEWGYNAWEKLISMSNFQGDATTSRKLAESKSCAFDEESKLAEESIRTPVRQGVAYLEARKLFEKAMEMEEGTERDSTWRQAAASYKVALNAAPDRDEAPEAAMNGAYAYKQVGEYDKAISMYEMFIENYGDEDTLATLKRENPEQYEQRVKFLSDAYGALASAYVLFFDYPKAAETFSAIADTEHFSNEERQAAAKQALILYVNLDDAAGMESARRRYAALGADAEELAEADYLIASAALKKWDPNSPDTGANEQARFQAQNSMALYYERNRNRSAAAKYAVRAAYNSALARKAGRSPSENEWWTNTVQAFDRYMQAAPKENGQSTAVGTPEASMAAEAAYRLIDTQLRNTFDYDTGHHRYKGTVVEVINQYQQDAKEAKKWYDELQEVVDKYVSQKWATVAIARQGSVYDSLRTGLYNTRPPDLKMFTAQQERQLQIAEESGNLDLVDKADQIRMTVREAWRKKRDQELDSADRIVVDRYATAVMLGKRYNLSHESITRAIRRLAFLTEVVGEAKMSEYTSSNTDLEYNPGMFQRMRPGVTSKPETDIMVSPSPMEVP